MFRIAGGLDVDVNRVVHFGMTEIELSAGTIEYEDTGGDGPVIVLLHGLLMDSSLWADVVAELSTDFRCLAPTLPMGAHRDAMHDDADLSLPRMAGLVAEFLDRLDLHDVTLVGNDTGGALVQLLACDDSPRIGRIAGVVRGVRQLPGPRHGEDACADRQTAPCAFRPVHATDAVAAGPTTPDRLRLADQARRRHHRSLDEARPAAARDSPGRGPDAARHRGTAEPLGRHSSGPAEFERPALVVWASEDRVMPLEHGRRLSELLPDARLVEIADSYTLLPLDQPARLAGVIREFVLESAADVPAPAVGSPDSTS